MKFLIIVLAIRFVIAWLVLVSKGRKVKSTAETNAHAKHPAEYQLR